MIFRRLHPVLKGERNLICLMSREGVYLTQQGFFIKYCYEIYRYRFTNKIKKEYLGIYFRDLSL